MIYWLYETVGDYRWEVSLLSGILRDGGVVDKRWATNRGDLWICGDCDGDCAAAKTNEGGGSLGLEELGGEAKGDLYGV